MPERKLRVFLCHASQDKLVVRELYHRLLAEGWIDPWLDEEKLLPGQDWDLEVEKAIRTSDAIVICLSKKSISKEGYVQKEIKRALDISDEKPDNTIYIVPLRLEECEVPLRIRKWQWVDYFVPTMYKRLKKSLRVRAHKLKIQTTEKRSKTITPFKLSKGDKIDYYRFIKIDLDHQSTISYPFWIAKYPVTNRQYARFLNADDFAREEYWLDFRRFDEQSKPIGALKDEGLKWLRDLMKGRLYYPRETWKVKPQYWDDREFGIAKPLLPVVGISWYEANAYCKWLIAHWKELPESSAKFLPRQIRLPLELETVLAAGGHNPKFRYPWDKPGLETFNINEIVKHANVRESRIGHPTPVNKYPDGQSPYGVIDMAGNVWEWQANYRNQKNDWLALRGGSWDEKSDGARVVAGSWDYLYGKSGSIGFRVLCIPL